MAGVDLRGLPLRSRCIQLRVKHSAVTGEGTTTPVQRYVGLVGYGLRQTLERVVQPEVGGRAGGVQGDGTQATGHLQVRQKPFVGELDHIDELNGLELLTGGFRLHDVETLGAAGSIHHNGNRTAAKTLLGPFELGFVSLEETLRLPRGTAAQTSGVQRGHRHSGAFT